MSVSSEGLDWGLPGHSHRSPEKWGPQVIRCRVSEAREVRISTAERELWKGAWRTSVSSSERGARLIRNIPPTSDFLPHKPQGATHSLELNQVHYGFNVGL